MRASPPLTPSVLAALDLFTGLTAAALTDVGGRARLRHIPKDTRIFAQGDAIGRCHALIDGSVRISQTAGEGAEVVMRFIGAREMFGSVALFTDGRAPAEAVALTDCVEISWSKADLIDLIALYPGIGLNLVKIIGARLGEAQDRVRELSTQRVGRRLANALLRLAGEDGRSAGEARIEFPLTRKDVAELAGTTLHTASRILSAWEKAGLVSSDRQRVTILRPSGIKRIADDIGD
ncbi:Crp/Fnr family transcriptional regulator [Methylocella tundrae]|uniref:Cyclic nucleotide-binding protein n=1 Tax=Methylocella tundrae TaxID=227605 RepID=A0A4U8Z264_METTU|nr:Crp/Fnr family transcriptional regulator [Methylocella tundrae]WPP03366.1 Crp/Fnr family transcriptional regulator [Methylocella tundrae]VFU09413.1 Cyclic nucleotide-binding protein [Methylocella tundrae]